ncbi:hypothetical protein NPIL_309961, partial [Nephila pilipes]
MSRLHTKGNRMHWWHSFHSTCVQNYEFEDVLHL